MTRAEALTMATETVEKIQPGTNSRGYAETNAARLSERTSAVLRIAEFLMNEDTRDDD